MAQDRRLEGLADDTTFLNDVVKAVKQDTFVPRLYRDPSRAFEDAYTLAVEAELQKKGVAPHPYMVTLRDFFDKVFIPEGVKRFVLNEPDPTAPREPVVIPAPRSLSEVLSPAPLYTVDQLVQLFQLRILAAGLTMREAILAYKMDAHTDPLTGLSNRAGMDAYIARLLKRDPELTGGVFFLDVDHFKRVNDRNGHEVGDQALGFVGRTVAENVRGLTDEVVRLNGDGDHEQGGDAVRMGGEEVVGLLPGIANIHHVTAVAERVRAVIANLAQETLGFPLTVTIGTAVGRFANINELLKVADARMYRGKQAGRDRVVSTD